jgi:hypothetical protein
VKHKLFIPIFQEGKYVFQFTKEELEKLLDETYEEGYKEGRNTCLYPYSITTSNSGTPTYDSTKITC